MVLIFQLLCVIASTMYKNMVCELLWICVHVILQTKTIYTYIYCVMCFYSTGLYMEGIYKVSGIKSKVQHLRRMYNIREAVQLSDFELPVITSLLKQFLRLLSLIILVGSEKREWTFPKLQQIDLISYFVKYHSCWLNVQNNFH